MRETVSECLCICVCVCVRARECACVSNKGEKTTHLNVRYREVWHAGREG